MQILPALWASAPAFPSHREPVAVCRMKSVWISLALILILFAPVAALAEEYAAEPVVAGIANIAGQAAPKQKKGQTEITSTTLDMKEGSYVFEGSVIVHSDDALMTADSALYEKATEVMDASGHYFYEDQFVKITASRAQMGLSSKLGTLYDGEIFFKKDTVTIRGDVIRKVGEDSYVVDKATATTCTGPDPAWCISGEDIDVTFGGWLTARDATFRVNGVPVLYTPYIAAPVLRDRQSGFLFPSFGYSSDKGFLYSQPFFWAISDNRDATITLDSYTRRGVGLDLEHRYILPNKMQGTMEIYAIADNEQEETYYKTSSRHRWNDSFIQLNLVNHNDFYREYGERRDERTARYLQSTAETSIMAGPVRMYAAAEFYQDLLEGSRDIGVIERLPELGAFLTPLGMGPVTLTAGSGAVNFEREEGYEGQRYEAWALAAHSIGRGLVLSQEAQARTYIYALEDDGMGDEADYAAHVFGYKAALSATFNKKYGPAVWHSVEPSVEYQATARQGDTVPVFDYEDYSATETSTLSATLMNRVGFEGGSMSARLRQSYDYLAEVNPLSPLVMELAYSRLDSVSLTMTYDHYEGEMTQIDGAVKLNFEKLYVNMSETYNLPSDIATYKLDLGYNPSPKVSLRTGVSFDEDHGAEPEEVYAGLGYNSQCWGVMVTVVRETDNFTVRLTVNLFGIGSYTIR